MAFLRFAEVRKRVGLSRSTIWRLEKRGLFVKRRQLSANRVAWPEDEIEAWLRSRCCAAAEAPSAVVVERAPSTILQWLARCAERSPATGARAKRRGRRSPR
jgi:prophage regulatory protein